MSELSNAVATVVEQVMLNGEGGVERGWFDGAEWKIAADYSLERERLVISIRKRNQEIVDDSAG